MDGRLQVRSALIRPGVAVAVRPDAGGHPAASPAWIYGKRPGLPLARRAHSHVSDFSMLMELRKYCGFSMTGIFVIPMMTASGPISEDDGVLLPLET